MPETRRAGENSRQAAEQRGRKGERLAALYLMLKFYRVRTHAGELDLVARAPSGEICFIEVKARPQAAEAAESILPRQRERIARAAALYLSARPALRHKGVRFDAMLIAPGRWPRHLKDAWRPDPM